MSPLQHRAIFQRLCAFSAIMTTAFALSTAAYAADSIEHIVTGKWKLTAALDGADITSLDEREAQQLVGHVFIISKEKVKFDKRDCGPTEFETEKVEPTLHLRKDFHASAEKLGLPSPVTTVDLNCTSVFIKKPNNLVIFWGGWFFDAVRIKR